MNPSTTGFPDHNVVTIGTPAGKLFLTTDGVDCISTGTDDGVWHVIGGTGTPSDPIRSFSTYTGTITLDR